MFTLRRPYVDSLFEHIVFIHEDAVRDGALGFNPLDRVRIVGQAPDGDTREINGILNFCRDGVVTFDEIGLSEDAFRDLALPEGSLVDATIAPAPPSVDLVRGKLRGKRLDEHSFRAILDDVVRRSYSKIELSMFVLACALRSLDRDEIVGLTRAMIESGEQLDFGPGPVAGKHCIGGVPGNRTTMIVVPILAAAGVTIPKTSSRAITSSAGTADTMETLAEVTLPPERLHHVVREAGGCIAWGGALALAPADDILITVERPMEVDTEPQMVASILAKQKSAGATHVLVDIPVGRSAKVKSTGEAALLGELFTFVADAIGLELEIVTTDALGPIGRGIGPRLEALDVLEVLRGEPDAPVDLREKSIGLAGRLLELVGRARAGVGRGLAAEILDDGRARAAFERIVELQGPRDLPRPARLRHVVTASSSGTIAEIDCWQLARVAKHAGAPVNPSSGVLLHAGVGARIESGDALFEIHADTQTQLDFAVQYVQGHPGVVTTI
ncbi:MAG: thymidine phosphorylase family protein [Acidimicrobiia bacterium]